MARELTPEEWAQRIAEARERVRQRAHHELVLRERRALLVLLAFVLLCLPNFRIARVVGHSMEPQFHDGDRLLLLKSWRWFAPLVPGDIIVFDDDDVQLVKRVAFVQNRDGTAPWQHSVETSNGRVTISPADFPGGMAHIDRIPSHGHYHQRLIYVLGDNLPISEDSREFGPIAPEQIIGKVLMGAMKRPGHKV